MSLLAILAAVAAQDPTPPPPPEMDPPVARPTEAPHNASAPCVIPTPDSTGSTIHPSAIDMGAQWNGYRYWMANTPYAGQDAELENPCIWASHDADTWVIPPGGTNPLYPSPPSSGYWADTDLLYDPDGDQLVLVFNDGGNICYIVTSDDGITWPSLASAVTIPRSAFPASPLMLSPSLVRVDAYLWRMYFAAGGGAILLEAPTPLGPWGSLRTCTGLSGWHQHVILDSDASEFKAISSGGNAFRSPDGVSWQSLGSSLPSRPGWEADGTLYRACMRPYDALTYHVWYSIMPGAATPDPDNPFVGYTRIPRSAWE